MLDINLIREQSDKVRRGLEKRGLKPSLVDDFLKVDNEWRKLVSELDELRAEQKRLSKEKAIEKAKVLKTKIKKAEEKMETVEKERNLLLEKFPNVPADDVPAGTEEAQNEVVHEVGKKPSFNFKVKDYLTIAEELDAIDIKRAAKVAGSRFGYLKNKAALLELALINFAFSHLVKKGFVPVFPPVMIKPEVYRGMGRLAAGQEEERYYFPKDEMFLIGSAEHTLGPMHMDEVLKSKELPKRYAGFSTCFRREAGSYGKDTKGILRVHQFDKVEMFSFSAPEKSEEEHQFLLACQEEMMQELGLPYRVVKACAGESSWTDYKMYDIETWLPGQNQYRETHSCSNTTDFQARGINCKHDKGGYVHMLNATALAMGRMIIAIIENYQTQEGGFDVPEALRKYLI